MITYNEIHDVRMREQTSRQLQKLPDSFMDDVKRYICEKREIASKESSGLSDVTAEAKKQLDNALTLFRELIRIRKKKILDLVLIAAETGISKQDFENMLDFEKELFENLMERVENTDKKIKDFFLSNQNKIEITFKEDVSDFMDMDGNKIGPFKKGEKIKICPE
ncbi:MAG: hypothetical protein AABX71_01540, partial [Nanoarchaeota archaeon]